MPLPKGGDFGKESGFLSWEIEDMLLGEVSHANEPRSGSVEPCVGVDVALFVGQDAITCGAEMSGVAFGKNWASAKGWPRHSTRCSTVVEWDR